MLRSRLTDTVRVEPSRWSRPGLGDETERGHNELEPLHRKFSQDGGCPPGIRGYLERLYGAGRDVGSFCKQVKFALEPDTPGPHQEREHLVQRRLPNRRDDKQRHDRKRNHNLCAGPLQKGDSARDPERLLLHHGDEDLGVQDRGGSLRSVRSCRRAWRVP